MMTQINGLLASKGIYFLTLLLLLLGVYGRFQEPHEETHLHEYRAGCNIFHHACPEERWNYSVALDTLVNVDKYVNPIPHGLMLTANRCKFSTTGAGTLRY